MCTTCRLFTEERSLLSGSHMWRTRQPPEGKFGEHSPGGARVPAQAAQRVRAGEAGNQLSPRLWGPWSRPGRGHLQPVITFPEPEDSARVRTDVQTRRLCDVPLVLRHRPLCTHLHVPTRLHIHTHAYAHTHTPQPRCGPEDDRLSLKLLGFMWEFMVGQGAGDWGKDT